MGDGVVSLRMIAEPLVSVVIPTYNRAHCVAKTIDSVLAQTHQNFEILVCDDGSKDDTAAVIERVYGADKRVRYLHQKNAGVSAARNLGLRSMTGDFVALLDSDDLWLPWKTEAQLKCLAALPDAGMVWTDMTAVDPAGNVKHERYLRKMYSAYEWFPDRADLFERSFPLADVASDIAAKIGNPKVYTGDIFSEMVLGNLVHTSTVLLRRERAEKVVGFDVSLKRSGEDYDYHLRTCREGRVAYIDTSSLLYQVGADDQLTVAKYAIDMARNFLATIQPIIEKDRARIHLPPIMIDEVLAEAHGWYGECLLEEGNMGEARKHLAASLRHKPKQRRMATLLASTVLPSPVRDGLRRVKGLMRGRA